MAKHLGSIVISTLITATVCGVIGETIWPTGMFLGFAAWLVAAACLVTPIVYILVLFARHDMRLLRGDGENKRPASYRSAIVTATVLGLVVTFGLGFACVLISRFR
jgi:uncharacterized membrane protein YphA (DoxX/SURF4 family)